MERQRTDFQKAKSSANILYEKTKSNNRKGWEAGLWWIVIKAISC